jgi:hypothetical protein
MCCPRAQSKDPVFLQDLKLPFWAERFRALMMSRICFSELAEGLQRGFAGNPRAFERNAAKIIRFTIGTKRLKENLNWLYTS